MPQRLASSARASLLWGGGFTLLRDIAQFGVMLVLVRLLSPSDYGTAALAQAIVGFVSVFSFATFSSHALQVRRPEDIDWQAHFSAATVINSVLAGLVLALAFGLSRTATYAEIALPLAALALVFIIEIPGTLRHRMLEAAHDWKRFRLLLLTGTLLGLGSGLFIAVMGGGVWALIIQVPALGLPAAIDLLFVQRFKPSWTWSWSDWKETFRFGLDRLGAGVLGRGRLLNEQVLLSQAFGLSTLGIFSRANGLAVLIAGRIGPQAMMSLYPVITRADSASERFRRLANIVLRGVLWITLPAVAFLCISAHDTVALLYGERWTDVAELLPLAAVSVGSTGITTVLSGLLVANNCSRTSLGFEVTAALTSMVVAVALIPFGVASYLVGLGAHGAVFIAGALALLLRRGAMTRGGIAAAFFPAVAAAAAGLLAVLSWRSTNAVIDWLFLRLAIEATIFAALNLVVLRFAFERPLAELLELAPGGALLARLLSMSRG